MSEAAPARRTTKPSHAGLSKKVRSGEGWLNAHPNSVVMKTAFDRKLRQRAAANRKRHEADYLAMERWGRRGCLSG